MKIITYERLSGIFEVRLKPGALATLERYGGWRGIVEQFELAEKVWAKAPSNPFRFNVVKALDSEEQELLVFLFTGYGAYRCCISEHVTNELIPQFEYTGKTCAHLNGHHWTDLRANDCLICFDK